ncbi:single-stranded DNA-binding protein [Carnobacterium pleistocenium]|uniref:single-stranded DNA-binding protein n=1 Tax=Carnobacterium pleistocenium TaxID=181073 RepID=UPI000553F83D|nr:single-stranded DNA-binding protein [Carnobacterium pleistocenium]
MINNIVLTGRLTKDADLRYTAAGKAVATFNLAVNRQFTNAKGEHEADFPSVVIWGKSAETLANFTRKGTLIGITGRLQTRSYDNKDGQRVYVTEVVAESFTFLEKKADNVQSNGSSHNQSSNEHRDPFDKSNGQPIDIQDDDLPL